MLCQFGSVFPFLNYETSGDKLKNRLSSSCRGKDYITFEVLQKVLRIMRKQA